MAYVEESAEALKRATGQSSGDCYLSSRSTSPGTMSQEDDRNWFLAVGSFEGWGKGRAYWRCTDKGMEYELQLTYRLFDEYNWDEGKVTTVGGHLIQDSKIARLHVVGLAQDYDLHATVNETYYWNSNRTNDSKSISPPPTNSRQQNVQINCFDCFLTFIFGL